MVAVIEEVEYAGGAQYIEFKVYQSPTDPNVIRGSWRLASSGAGGTVVDESRVGTTIETEFRHVLECADLHGIPFVWVNDPEELFPPYYRR